MFPSQRATSSRRAFILLAALLAAGIFVLFGRAQAPTGQAQHVIVKINSSLAKDVESALPMQTMELVAGSSGNARIEAFFSKYGARKLRPVYPNIVRSKKQNGFTDLQIATAIQQKFAKRASRLHASFHPPEISRTYVLEFDPAAKLNLQATLKSLSADADVEFAEQDHLASVNFTPNDPYFSSSGSWGQAYDDLWGIKKIGSPAAWDTTAGAGIIVAVVDTGVDYNHPDIAANIWINPGEIPNNGIDDDHNGYIDDVMGWDFIGSTYTNPTQSNNPIDHFGHGTHVAGTIAAVGNNGIGVIGVAWQSRIMIVKGLDDTGNGLDSTLGPAIMYAANNGADVISNSWAGTGTSQTIADAVSYAYNLGAVIVAAAGNNADDARNYFPANLPQVITVAATDHNDAIAWFSNWGDKIDVAAPGVDILSLRAAGTSMGTPVDAYYTRADGTSMATPHVSGLAALILAQNAAYSNEDVRQVLRVSATDLGTAGFDLTYGYGRINAAGAMTVPSVLEAKIIAPADGTSLTGAVTLTGYAGGNNFSQYTLAYGVGSAPATWTTFSSGTTPVAGGALGVFDPTQLSNGLYTIRLTSYDTSNNAFVDQIEVQNNVISISSPLPSVVPSTAVEFKPGQVIAITGTAQGASFQDFRLDWAEGINPSTGWSSTGITVAGGGATPVISGPLGSWDSSAVVQTDFYTIRLSVDNAGFTNVATTLVYLDTSLQSSGWPQPLNQAPYFSVGVVPSLDSQGLQRLTTVTPAYANSNIPAQFWSFPPGGGSPSTVTLSYGEFFQPAAGAIYGGAGQQVVVADGLNLDVFQPDNTYSTFSTGQPITFQFSQIVLADLENNSQLETVALGDEFANNTAYLYAWRSDGTQLNSNFPISIPDQNINLTESRTGPRVLVGDVNGDGNKEFVVQAASSSSTTSLLLFAHDGTPLAWSAPVLSGYANQMILADLDHNGKLETLILDFTGSQEVLHVLQPDGTERPGWPIVLNTAYTFSYLAVGDITRTGHDQIVVANYNSLYVLNADGTPLSSAWPLANVPGTLFGPPVLADVDGGGKPEIVLTRFDFVSFPGPLSAVSGPGTMATTAGSVASLVTSQPTESGAMSLPAAMTNAGAQSGSSNYYDQLRLVAYRPDASTAKSWNLFAANGLAPTIFGVVTVGSFDSSGTTEIAVTYATTPANGGTEVGGVVTVLTTGTPFNSAANDWPMIFQNPQNAAVYRPPLNVSIASPAAGANINGVVNLVANVTDKVATPTVQFQIDGANFGAPITSAPYSMNWDTSTVSLGTHTISALASDSSSNNAASPTVTVTVTAPQLIFASPTSLNLGSIMIGSTTPAQTITISNSGQTTYSLSAVNVTGDFAETDNCVGSLAAGANCTINVTFTPSVRGPETGSLSVSGNFTGPSPTVNLTGTGQALQGAVSPTSLTFGTQPLHTGSTQQVTYSNTGDLPITITGISTTGDFLESGSCNSPLVPGANCVLSVTFVPTAAGVRTGTLTISGNVNVSVSLSGTGQVGQVSVSPTSVSFGNQNVNTTSAPQTVTVTSNGNGPATIAGWSYPGGVAVTNNCPFSLASGSSCTFTLTYSPTSPGPLNGSFSFSGSFQNSPASVALTGTGIGPAGFLSPASLAFGTQLVNSASASQPVTLFNTGNAPMTISGIVVSGDFAQTNNCGASLAGGASCAINVTFQPMATGARSGTLQVNTNVTPALATVSLSGTGGAPALSFSPATFSSFGNQRVNTTSAAQTMSITNTGSASLSITSFATTPGFNQTNTCGNTVAAGGSCSVSVTFAPTAQGALSGTLTLNSNLPGTAPSFALNGTGTASAATLSATSLAFGAQLVGTASAAQPITLTNSGTASLNISSISSNFDFSETNNCPSSLGAGASCTINVTFTPSASGTRSGVVSIADDAANGNPQSVALSGSGYTLSGTFNPSSLTFGSQRVGTTSSAQNVSLINTGTGALSISGFLMSGDFAQTNNCPSSLASGATCTVSVVFVPSARGARAGALTLSSNATGTPPSVSLMGTGIGPVASLSPASLIFAAQMVSTTSSSQNVTLSNTGDSTLDISSITASAGFAETNNCGTTLSAGSHCTVSVKFTPTAAGALTGTLTVTDDAANGSPQTTSLSGTGVDFSLSASPSSVTVTHGTSGNLTMTVSAQGGSFNSSVNLACSAGLPKGANCSFSPGGVTPGSGSATSTLKISTNGSTPPGSYVITVRGTSGSDQHTTAVTLQVN